jgi:hypothetical protein
MDGTVDVLLNGTNGQRPLWMIVQCGLFDTARRAPADAGVWGDVRQRSRFAPRVEESCPNERGARSFKCRGLPERSGELRTRLKVGW